MHACSTIHCLCSKISLVHVCIYNVHVYDYNSVVIRCKALNTQCPQSSLILCSLALPLHRTGDASLLHQ